MDAHSLSVLEFDKIRSFVKAFASSPGGRKRCESLMPLPDAAQVEELLREVTEMRMLLEVHGSIPIRGVQDIARSVEQSRIHNFYLEPGQLLDIRETLEVARAIRGFFSALQETCPLLHAITCSIIPLPDIESRIRQSIAPDGTILDTASAELAQIRGRLKSLRLSILNILERMVNDETMKHVFQEEFITLRNNRYVLPVRTDCKSAVPGVVHDQSQSKATFFIEPFKIVNLNNELQILRQEESFEIVRILTGLTQRVREFHADILADLAILERMDVIYAKGLFSKALDAREPLLSRQGIVELKGCRHPILLARFVEDETLEDASAAEEGVAEKEKKGHWEFNRPGVVPIDLIKDDRTATLIITGANAGGKTVAMKTLGLFTLMAQAGLHIPVEEGSRISVYTSVFADIGDEQNIEASLSTFSAHMVRIDQIVRAADAASLVLLDELGSGTDPAEGAALALGILDFLRECGCFTVATTHLNLLKTYAYLHGDVQNVSVEFDPVTLKPIYSLVYGMPGLSNALAIAKNLGMSPRILEKANQYIKDADRQIINLIQGLEKTQQEIYEEQQRIKDSKERAVEYERKAQDFLEGIRTSKERILKEFERDARKLLKESEQELMKIVEDKKKKIYVRPGEDKEALQKVKKKLHDQFPKSAGQKEAVEHLEVGQMVRVAALQKSGIVAAVDEASQKAEVVIGTMKIKAAFRELELAEKQKQAERVQRAPAAPVVQQPSGPGVARVNVIGMHVDEALPAVDKAIDRALLQGSDTLEIIHGVGTGRLMKAIRDHIKDHQCVSRFAAGDHATGGAGITIVEIKG